MEPEGPPLPLADAQWQILRSEPSPGIAADSFRPVVAIDPEIAVEAAQAMDHERPNPGARNALGNPGAFR